jgi:hypothetical protein
VRAPKERRSLDEIVVEALKVIDPPLKSCDEWRAKVVDRIRRVQIRSRIVRARELKKSVDDYDKALRVTREKAFAFVLFPSKELLERLDDEIAMIARFRQLSFAPPPLSSKPLKKIKKKGKKPRDLDAEIAVRAAHDLIADCPWKKKPSLYVEGAWHRLSMLFYEARTGVADKDIMHYLRNWEPPRPQPPEPLGEEEEIPF